MLRIALLCGISLLMGCASTLDNKDLEIKELSRYEIVHSPTAADQTYLLDTFSGKIWRLNTRIEIPRWAPMKIENPPPEPASHARYALKLSSQSTLRVTMHDVETGRTWVLVRNILDGGTPEMRMEFKFVPVEMN